MRLMPPPPPPDYEWGPPPADSPQLPSGSWATVLTIFFFGFCTAMGLALLLLHLVHG